MKLQQADYQQNRFAALSNPFDKEEIRKWHQ
jgi:hypothetical protein